MKERNVGIVGVLNFINSQGNKNLEGAFYAIFRIRNNMFHGLKGHAELDNQIELFESMCEVLEGIN